MKGIIRELRRREVFRTAGLYVGICWIAIEGASVVLPAFNAPDWVLQILIIAVVVGFPVMLVLAWIYDVSEKGIEVQADPTDTVVVPLGRRKSDFVVIGVLTVALTLSVYLNLSSGPDVVTEPEPVTILIADFDNQTGDPIFDDTLEQTLNIGIEGATFVSAFNRLAAQSQIRRLRPDSDLDEEGARLIAVREGIKLVLTGAIHEENGRYLFSVQAVQPEDGTTVVEVEQKADDKTGVLMAVSLAADEIRKGLGDTSVKQDSLRSLETFTAGSLEAAQQYTMAQNLAYLGDYDASVTHYRRAVELDGDFGRAYSGWALAAFHLGRSDEAEELWQKALALMDTMTERERFRTLGLYYMVVSKNYQKAIENYEALVTKYPADGAGHNNLAVAYFTTLNFERAMQEGQEVLDIYPSSIFYQQNFALYAMYAGNFELAEERGRNVIDLDDSRYYAWLPVAVGALARSDFDAASTNYSAMAQTGERGASHANLGLADLALYQGRLDDAVDLLTSGIDADIESGNQRLAATKYIVLADALDRVGNEEASAQAIDDAFNVSGGLSRQVPAALLHLRRGRYEAARVIADELGAELQPQRRAYANMILGAIDSLEGRHVDAIDKLTRALELSDFWLIRLQLGQAYLRAESWPEALDEFMACGARRGEASAIYLDDLPTWRYLSELPYWLARAQQELGMSDAASQNYTAFLDLRPTSDALAADAGERLASLAP